jgi:glycosyltransferase involved in cell wall biosynthesis
VVSNSLGYARTSPVLSRFLDKVRVIPKGVDPARLSVGATTEAPNLGLPPDTNSGGVRDRRVLFVGRLVSYKGLPVLLEAVHRLVQEGLGLHLYLAGRGPEEASLRRWAEAHGLGSRVSFLGFVPDERLGPLYRWADVVACPSVSRMESSPTCLEEAASLGTPVLGSNLPGASETIPSDGVHGLLVTPGDAAGVVEGLRRLVNAAHWAPATVRSWNDVGRDYLRLYAQLTPELAHLAS